MAEIPEVTKTACAVRTAYVSSVGLGKRPPGRTLGSKGPERADDREGSMDMISASAADAHRFGRVKRNGYDPAEVDAVVSRLVEALRGYEQKTERLEERLAEADASADAIRKTFIAAERTRDEILDSAREQAETIRTAARSEAEEVVSTARTQAAELTDRAQAEATDIAALAQELDHEIAERRASILASAHEEAESIVTTAEGEAAARIAEAMTSADELAARAEEDAEGLRHASGQAAQAASVAASWIRREAFEQANAIVGEADERAALLLADAERDRATINQRVTELRAAIVGLEASARNLADVTATEMSVIDLSEIEAIEENAPEDEGTPAPVQPAEGPDTALTTPQDLPEMREPQYPVAVDARETPEPVFAAAALEPAEVAATDHPQRLLTVAEATAALDLEESDPTPDVPEEHAGDPGPKTYYQRSTGVPLSERVKIARKSG